MSSKPTVLILGTDHLDNPNNGDMFMTETNSILTEKRQAEIKDVITCLKRYAPTKIALEVLTSNRRKLNREYTAYLKGDFSLTANERHQFVFQLAKHMNHHELFAIDWNENITTKKTLYRS